VKLDAVSVDACMAVENVALTAAPGATPAAPLPGAVPVTVGGVGPLGAGGGIVVKVAEYGEASAVPLASFTAVVIETVYVVPFARGAPGVSVAVLPLAETAAATGADAPCAVSVKLELVTVVVSRAAENVTDTTASVAMPVEPAAGIAETTVGGVPTACAAESPTAPATTRRTSASRRCLMQ
jgi:hypothetical protein